MTSPEQPSLTSLGQKQPRQYSQEELSNEDIVQKILESGSEQEMKQLQEQHGLSQEQMGLFRHFAQLRQEAIQQIKQDVQQRIQQNPQATDQEFAMGAYLESIEPQVREAVQFFRQKGYPTAGSGFWGPGGSQSIYFDQEVKDINLPEKITHELSDLELKVDSGQIAFTPKERMDLDQLKNVWDKIAAALPDLGQPAAESETPQAKIFRKKQAEYRSGNQRVQSKHKAL